MQQKHQRNPLSQSLGFIALEHHDNPPLCKISLKNICVYLRRIGRPERLVSVWKRRERPWLRGQRRDQRKLGSHADGDGARGSAQGQGQAAPPQELFQRLGSRRLAKRERRRFPLRRAPRQPQGQSAGPQVTPGQREGPAKERCEKRFFSMLFTRRMTWTRPSVKCINTS